MEYYLAIKIKKSFHLQKDMAKPWEHYNKWNKSEREGQILYDPTCVWNIKTQTNLYAENRLVVTRGKGWRIDKISEGGQKIPTSHYKRSCDDIMYNIVTTVNNSNTVLYIENC